MRIGPPGVKRSEFSDDSGKAYAMVALKAEQLMRCTTSLRIRLCD